MKMKELRVIAKTWNVNAGIGRSKQDVIRDIQVREGFTPCFRTKTECGETGCLWRDDCIPKRS